MDEEDSASVCSSVDSRRSLVSFRSFLEMAPKRSAQVCAAMVVAGGVETLVLNFHPAAKVEFDTPPPLREFS